jgi:hypothetical protein
VWRRRHAQQLQGVAAFTYRVCPRDAKHVQGFYGTVFGLGDDRAALVQRGAGGVDRVEVIVFAFTTTIAAVWAVDLEDGDTGFGQMPGQTGAVGASALDADASQFTEPSDPGQQRPVSGAGGGKATGPQDCFGAVDNRGDVQFFMRIDPGIDDLPRPGRHTGLAL